MENKIEIDFSKLKETIVSKPKKTNLKLCINATFLILAFVIAVKKMVEKPDICNSIVVLFSIFALSLVVILFILHKLDYIQLAHEIEEKKADATLRRKLAEEAILREIKIREKEISDAQKCKQEIDKYKDIECDLNNLKLLHSVKNDEDRKKEINNTIKSLENKLSELKKS